jgi:hypothetical protein
VGICHGSPRGTPSGRIADHLRDDVATLLDQDAIAGRTSLRAIAFGVVQRRHRDGAAGELDRLEHGMASPPRPPTLTSIAVNVVVACCAGNLKAVAHRGNFAVALGLRVPDRRP